MKNVTRRNILMKRFTAVMMIMLLCSLMVFTAACSPLNSDEEAAIKKDVYDIYDVLRTSWKEADDIDGIKEPVREWAEDNGISCTDIDEGSMMLNLDATDRFTDAKGTIISCSIGLDDTKQKSQCAAIALSAVKNCSEHGNIRVLFTAVDDKGRYGAEGLDKKYLSMDNFISIGYWPKTKLFTGSASSTEFTFKRNIQSKTPEGNTAYKVEISDLEGGDSSDRSRKHPNPIITLGELLNSLNQNDLVFELADFNGGSSSGDYAKDASMTIVIDDNYAKKFEERVNAKITSFEESYIEKESDLSFTCAPCKMPEKVYSDDDLTNIISLFYTIEDGKIEDEEESDDSQAIANVGLAKDNGKTLTIKAKARALSSEQISALATSYESTAKLAQFKLTSEDTYPGWPFKESSDLIDRYVLATNQVELDLEPEWTLSENECAVFYSKKPEMDMIGIGANIENGPEIAESLVLCLRSLGGES